MYYGLTTKQQTIYIPPPLLLLITETSKRHIDTRANIGTLFSRYFWYFVSELRLHVAAHDQIRSMYQWNVSLDFSLKLVANTKSSRMSERCGEDRRSRNEMVFLVVRVTRNVVVSVFVKICQCLVEICRDRKRICPVEQGRQCCGQRSSWMRSSRVRVALEIVCSPPRSVKGFVEHFDLRSRLWLECPQHLVTAHSIENLFWDASHQNVTCRR